MSRSRQRSSTFARMRESSSSADAVDAPAKVTSARMSGAELKLALFRQSGEHYPE